MRVAWLGSIVLALGTSQLLAQTPALSSIEAPYPAVQSAVQIAGGTYRPGSVSYGPQGTPLVLSGKDFGAEGTVTFVSYQKESGTEVKGTVAQANVSSWSPSILFLTVPSGAASGLVFVTVEGKASNGLPFIVTPGVYAGTCPAIPPSSELQITTASLPNGTAGQSYNATLHASGGNPPYNWSLTGGSLPSGLSLNASTGIISGTPATAAGPLNLTVQAADSGSQDSDAVLGLTVDSQTLTPATVYSYSATYQPNGNLLSYNDSVMGTWTFGYDNLNRLITGTPSAGDFNGQYACWTYDSFGNRTSEALSATACGGNPPLTSWATYNTSNSNRMDTTNLNPTQANWYDGAGNVLYDGVNFYSYDAESRVCAVETQSYDGPVLAYGYLYDAEGRRVAKGSITPSPWGQQPSCSLATNGFTLTQSYLLGQGGEELTSMAWSGSTSTWQRTNVYGAGKLLATYDTLGQHFHLSDPLGSRRVQVASSNAVAEEECQNLPFGDQQYCYPDPNATDAGADATPLHFTGKERDAESGNDYFEARYYGSSMGRFMSPDYSSDEDGPQPVPYANLEDPQGLNQYAYAGNNPLTFTDPDGHFPCPGGNGQDVACAVQAAVNWIKNLFSGGGGGGCTGTCVSDAPSGPPSNNPNFTPQLQTRTTTASNNSFRKSLPQFLGGPDACTQMDCSKLQIQQDIMPWGMVGGLGGASGLFSGAERNALNGVLKGIANGTNKGVEFENFAAKASGWAKPLPAQAAGYYRRYVVSLGAGKGAFRLVTGLGGEMYATFDHYVSWIKIR